MEGVEVQPHSFLTSTLHEVECPASRPDRFTPGERPLLPINSRIGGPQIRSSPFRGKILLASIRKRTRVPRLSNPQSSHCTDLAIPAPRVRPIVIYIITVYIATHYFLSLLFSITHLTAKFASTACFRKNLIFFRYQSEILYIFFCTYHNCYTRKVPNSLTLIIL